MNLDYTDKELLNIIKICNFDLYKHIKNSNKQTRKIYFLRYINSLGGAEDNGVKNIINTNNEIREHINKLQGNFNQIIEQLKISNDEKEELQNKLNNIGENVNNLESSSCDHDINNVQKYIENFNQIKEKLPELINAIQKTIDKKKLIMFDKNGDYSINNYNSLNKEIKEVENKIPKEITCGNIKEIQKYLEHYKNPNLYERILNDYEDLTNSVRIFAKIYNPKKVSNDITFNNKVIKSGKNSTELKKIEIVYSCSKEECNAPPSVIKNGKFIEKTQYPCSDNPNIATFKYNYGAFYSVFENVSNLEYYNGNETDNGLHLIKTQIEKGNDIFLFNYGYSGSGKTFTMIGNETNHGIIFLLLENLKYKSLSIDVYELYGTIDVPEEVGLDRYTNKINSEIINYGTYNTLNLNILNEISLKRKNLSHIKITPNNKESSRGHLFFKCNFILQNDIKVSCTLIDSAGIEDPFIISKNILGIDKTAIKFMNYNNIKLLLFNTSQSPIKTTFWNEEELNKFQEVNGSIDILRNGNFRNLIKLKVENQSQNLLMTKLFLFHIQKYFIKNDDEFIKLFGGLEIENINKDKLVKYIHDIITEGLYINETLNHLKYFLQKRMNIKNDIQIITPKEFFIGTETSGYTTDKLFISPDDSNNLIKMTQILNGLSPRTKFILSMNLRTDLNEDICSSTLNVLEFAQRITS